MCLPLLPSKAEFIGSPPEVSHRGVELSLGCRPDLLYLPPPSQVVVVLRPSREPSRPNMRLPTAFLMKLSHLLCILFASVLRPLLTMVSLVSVLNSCCKSVHPLQDFHLSLREHGVVHRGALLQDCPHVTTVEFEEVVILDPCQSQVVDHPYFSSEFQSELLHVDCHSSPCVKVVSEQFQGFLGGDGGTVGGRHCCRGNAPIRQAYY